MRTVRTGLMIGVISLFLLAGQVMAQDTINIVQLDPISGPFKDIGDRAVMGAQFAVDEINASGGLLGKKVKLMPEDSQLKPDVAVRKATKAILQDNAKIMIMLTGTSVARALMDVAEKEKVVLLNFGAFADYLTGKEFNRYSFRTVLSSSNFSRAFVEFFRTQPYRKFYLINQDYAYGHAMSEDFRKLMERTIPGVKIVGEEFHPMATKDFGPYISKIVASGAEIIYTANYGTDLEVMIKQGAQMGVKARYACNVLDDHLILGNVGNAAVGSYVSSIYLPTYESKENKAFLEKWHKKYKDTKHPWPTAQIGWSYNGTMFLAEAIKKAQSIDAEAIIKAWEGMKYTGIIGEQTMRACDHQTLQSGYVSEVQAKSELFKFPFPGKPMVIPMEKVCLAPGETGNPRCK